MIEPLTWNGDPMLADRTYGDRYYIDWEYASPESEDIYIRGERGELNRLVRVGDPLPPKPWEG